MEATEHQPADPRRGNGVSTSRTLIAFLHGIGDNIMFTGVLREYARTHPAEELELLTLMPACAAIWRNNPHVRHIEIGTTPLPHYWNPVRFYLRDRKRALRYIREFSRARGCDKIIFPTIQTLPEIIYHVTGSYGAHKVQRMARDLGLPPELYTYDLHPGADDRERAASFVAGFGKNLAVVHPFSTHVIKQMPSGLVSEILKSLRARNLKPVIVGSEADRKNFQPAWETEAIYGWSFGALVELLKHAQVFAGTDSAVSHLAGFAETPRVAVLSPKLKPSRYAPLSRTGKVTLIRTAGKTEPELLREFLPGLD